jgi:hypothetical protein
MWLQYTSLCDKEDYTGAFRQALGIVDRYYRDRTLIFSAAVQGDSDVMALAILRSFWRLGSSLADEHHQLIEWLLEVIKPELIDDLSVDLSKIAIDFCISLVRSRQRGGIAELAVDCVKIFLKYSPMLQNVTYHQSIFKHISAILLDFDGQICKKQVSLHISLNNYK